MFLIERERPSQRREFIVDCPHGDTKLLVDNFPRTDPARASGIWEHQIKQHRQQMHVAFVQGALDEECKCQVPSSARPSS